MGPKITDGQQRRIARALERALDSVPDAKGVVVLVVFPHPTDPDPKQTAVQIASGFRGREITDVEVRDLLRAAAGWEH